MRATFGIVMVFGGLLLGYAILSGKFPPASSSSSSSSSGTGEKLLTTPTTGTSGGLVGTIISPTNPLGLPTVKALASSDKLASTGGMQ